MNKKWVNKKNSEQKVKFNKQLETVLRLIEEVYEDKEYNDITREIINKKDSLYFGNPSLDYAIAAINPWLHVLITLEEEKEVCNSKYKKLKDNLELLEEYSRTFDMYEDSENAEFDGDIIITDPCYIIRRNNPLTEDDWDACLYGEEMENLGIKKYMTRNTIYGDWSCTTFNSDNGEKLGEFCADSGMVSVFDLDEILSYNPDYKNVIIERPWTVTLIKNFKGTVQFVVKQSCGVDDNGGNWKDYSVQVVGHGVDKTTGNAINFVGKQTGF